MGIKITSNVKGDKNEADFYLSFSYSVPGNISSHPFLIFNSGVGKVVFLDTGLTSQKLPYSLVRAEELLWSGIYSA